VQAVIEALDRREARRARQPLVVLGMIGPALLLLVMGLAAWWALTTIVRQADTALTSKALESKLFAAQLAAKAAANDLDLLFRAVEQVARNARFRQTVQAVVDDPKHAAIRKRLNEPRTTDSDQQAIKAAKDRMRASPGVRALRTYMEELRADEKLAKVASWFVVGPRGLHLARSPWNDSTFGSNWAWRTYFHGQPDDLPKDWRPGPDEHIRETQLSSVFLSLASYRWILGVSTPVYAAEDSNAFLGVLALTVQVGRDFGVSVRRQDRDDNAQQFAVLIDWRDNKNKGLIFQHPLLERLTKLPQRFAEYKVAAENLPAADVAGAMRRRYRDPLAADLSGGDFGGEWLAVSAPVQIRGKDSGFRVIVQERHEWAIGPTLEQLQTSLSYIGLMALAGVFVVWSLLWGFGARAMAGNGPRRFGGAGAAGVAEPAETVPMGGRGGH
jgi:hypothetical protein